ncbi:hypothetical protein SFC65_19240 [Priestia filamentosa]|uniref:hypothetical protein n=1 Tax=Priestia filamentosa TaxID=1402861 RepID=UPI003982AD0D
MTSLDQWQAIIFIAVLIFFIAVIKFRKKPLNNVLTKITVIVVSYGIISFFYTLFVGTTINYNALLLIICTIALFFRYKTTTKQ